MRVCLIDGQGGGLGRRLVQEHPVVGRDHELIGSGTNPAAAAAMTEAGAQRAGVGPKAIAETIACADVILTSLNMLFPDTGRNEVTPEMVRTILDTRGTKILLPVNRFRIEVAGTESSKLEQLIAHSLGRVRALLDGSPP